MRTTFVVRTLALGVFVSAAALASLGGGAPASAGGGGCHERPTPEASGDLVSIQGGCFSPMVLRVEPGTTVKFQNDDHVAHVVMPAFDFAPGYSPNIAPGESYTSAFEAAGTFPYYCNLHPGMAGVVVVGEGTSAAAGSALPVSARQAEPRAPADSPQPQPAAATSSEDGGPDDAWAMYLAAGLALAGVAVGAGILLSRRRS